ncbi:hypothetical protein JXQ31_17205 [candidate division KSB1 bacterium]|nr:hypothetical protein [candidate division KSB1 bacterium]
MAKVIIGVHGLGNKSPQKILSKWWIASIKEGFRNAGYRAPAFKFEMVYWADITHPVPLDPDEKDKKSPYYLESPYVPAKPHGEIAPSRRRLDFLNLLEKEMDKIFLNKDMSVNYTSLTDEIMKRYFNDLNIYYKSMPKGEILNEIPAKTQIRMRLKKVLLKYKRKDILLIGHSMGSIISYDVLSDPDLKVKVDTFITIGSPLGLPVIMSRIAAEQKERNKGAVSLNTPQTVKRNWYNFSDLHDKVAINYNLSDDYGDNENEVHVIDKIVYNDYECYGKKNPHKAYGYLRTPEMAEILYDFLTRDRNRIAVWFGKRYNSLVDKIFKKTFI